MYLILEYGDIIRDYCGDYRIFILQKIIAQPQQLIDIHLLENSQKNYLTLTHIEIGKVVHSQILPELMIALYQVQFV